MLEQLSYVLTPRVSPEFSVLVRHGFDVLTQMGFTDYEYEIITLINTVDILDTDSFIMGVLAVLNSGLNVVLSEHDIVLEFTDDELEEKIEVVESLQALSYFHDTDRILAHTDCESMQSDEAFACVLGEVTTRDETYWLTKIVSASPALIVAISDRMHYLANLDKWEEETEGSAIITDPVRARARARAKQYREVSDIHPLFAMSLITEGVPPGRPVSTYIDPIHDDLVELTLPKAELAAQNILFCVLLSDKNDEEVLGVSQQVCEDLYGVSALQANVHGYINEEYLKVRPQ